jgi:hypothetical protein
LLIHLSAAVEPQLLSGSRGRKHHPSTIKHCANFGTLEVGIYPRSNQHQQAEAQFHDQQQHKRSPTVLVTAFSK